MNSKPNRETIQWERMLPYQFRAAMEKQPICYLPLGTVEWHGEHNSLGLDSLKAHELCVLAAERGGGIVHPPVYGGMGGLDMPATVVMEGEVSWDNHIFRPWIEKLCNEFHRIGFKAIIMLTGHYGHNQQLVVRETAVRMSERLRIPVLGLPEYWLALDQGYLGDHAGIGETSLLMHLHPDMVELERIKEDPDYGKDGIIEKGSSAELGRQYTELIIERMSQLGKTMCKWDGDTLDDFIAAERELIQAQLKGWRHDQPWAFWQKIPSSELVQYGQLLTEGKFTEIQKIVKKLSHD